MSKTVKELFKTAYSENNKGYEEALKVNEKIEADRIAKIEQAIESGEADGLTLLSYGFKKLNEEVTE